MPNVLTALVPVFVLILMGFILRQRRMLANEFWLPCETLNYYYMFPALIFSQVAKANLIQFPVLPIAIAILGAIGIGALALYVCRIWNRQPGAVFFIGHSRRVATQYLYRRRGGGGNVRKYRPDACVHQHRGRHSPAQRGVSHHLDALR